MAKSGKNKKAIRGAQSKGVKKKSIPKTTKSRRTPIRSKKVGKRKSLVNKKTRKLVVKKATVSSKSRIKKAKKLSPWLNKDGTVKKSMLPYLTKKGKRRKNKKFPKGIRSIKQLWIYLEAKKIKKPTDKRLECQDLTVVAWQFKDNLDDKFDEYFKVFMGGKQITYSTWELYGYDYVDSITNDADSPPTVLISICNYENYKVLSF